MPKIKSALSLVREFKDSQLPDCSKKDPLIITARQASEADRMQRQAFSITPVRRQVDAEGRFSEEQVQASYRHQMAVEVYLCLASCNIEDRQGNLLLSFGKDGRYEGTFEHFLGQWGQIIHGQWTAWIHGRVIEQNPDFGFQLAPPASENGVEADEAPQGEAAPAETAG